MKRKPMPIAKAAEQIVKLSERLSGGDVTEAVKQIQWALYSFKVQENPSLPPPYAWH